MSQSESEGSPLLGPAMDMADMDMGDKTHKLTKDLKKGKGNKGFIGRKGKAKFKMPNEVQQQPHYRKRRSSESYATYLYKVLKQVHPECGISKKGMMIMNSFMNDIFDRMATESTRLLRTAQKKTLTSREIQTSVRLMLPGELSKHAVSEGTKAITKYAQNSQHSGDF